MENSSKIPFKFSLFPLLNCPSVPDEAFNLFHSVDRELYARLVHTLRRDPAESMQVMAFFIWLERQTRSNAKIVKTLLSVPPAVLDVVLEEAIRCLESTESEQGPIPGREIEHLPGLLNNREICLRYFFENREAVRDGVEVISNNVCARAFRDIVERASQANVAESSRTAERREQAVQPKSVARGPRSVVMMRPYVNVPAMPFPPPRPGTGGFIQMRQQPPPQGVARPMARPAIGIPVHVGAVEGYPVYDSAHRQMMASMEQLAIGNNFGGNREEIVTVDDDIRFGVDDDDVPPEERTIFLTFSKGYPISEDEVHAFFTRRFGNFIEEIIMQDVAEGEQVLYARMVCKTPEVIDRICGGNKAKYSINGKHVWARKYVKKQAAPPRASEASTSQQFFAQDE